MIENSHLFKAGGLWLGSWFGSIVIFVKKQSACELKIEHNLNLNQLIRTILDQEELGGSVSRLTVLGVAIMLSKMRLD